MPMTIRCYAEGRDAQWEAFCLDFDLAVQGNSFEAVYQDLKIAVEEYLAYVHGLPADEQARLLGRRVPMSVQLMFLWRILVHSLFRRRSGDGGYPHQYLMPAAA